MWLCFCARWVDLSNFMYVSGIWIAWLQNMLLAERPFLCKFHNMRLGTRLLPNLPFHLQNISLPWNNVSDSTAKHIPEWKGPRASANIRRRMRGYRSRVTARYHSVPPQTAHFQFDRKLINHEVASIWTLQNLGRNILDRGPLQTSFTIEMPLSHFFTLDHTHHQAAWRNWAWTARNR